MAIAAQLPSLAASLSGGVPQFYDVERLQSAFSEFLAQDSIGAMDMAQLIHGLTHTLSLVFASGQWCMI